MKKDTNIPHHIWCNINLLVYNTQFNKYRIHENYTELNEPNDVEFSFRVQTQAFELVMYEFYNDVVQAQLAPEGRLISGRTIFI